MGTVVLCAARASEKRGEGRGRGDEQLDEEEAESAGGGLNKYELAGLDFVCLLDEGESCFGTSGFEKEKERAGDVPVRPWRRTVAASLVETSSGSLTVF